MKQYTLKDLKKPLNVKIHYSKKDKLFFLECKTLDLYVHSKSERGVWNDLFVWISYFIDVSGRTSERKKHQSFKDKELVYRKYFEF